MFGVDEGVVGDTGSNVGVKSQRLTGCDVQLLKPPPCGVVIGAFRNTFVRRSDSQAGLDTSVDAAQVYFLTDLDCFDLNRRSASFKDVKRGAP